MIIQELKPSKRVEGRWLAVLEDDAPKTVAEPQVNYITVLEEELTGRLGRKIRIVKGRKKGRIELEFYNDEDFEALLAAMRQFKNK